MTNDREDINLEIYPQQINIDEENTKADTIKNTKKL